MQSITHTIHCRPDDEGDVVATLVHCPTAQASTRAVLYLHGFVDYFFQEHVAEAFTRRGFHFYALDLRKYGRSLRPYQHPNYCRSLEEYSEEIGAALAQIESDGCDDVTLIGHSTGCLIACLYAASGARRASIRRLVLNSPFLEFNEAAFTRRAGILLANFMANRSPFAEMPLGLSPRYGESLHVLRRGEWDYRLDWKPIEGFPVYAAWTRAIHEGHARVQRGLNLAIPVLLLHSDRSVKAGKQWRDEFMESDAVLDVAHMKRYGPGLGSRVTLREVPGGMHDLYLSRSDVREAALRWTLEWVERRTGESGSISE